MKKIAMIAVVLFLGITLLSADAGSWTLGKDSSLSSTFPEGGAQTATMDVSLNLTADGDNPETETITIGFSSSPVTEGDDVTNGISSAILTDNGNMQGTLSGENVRYIFWKIASPSKLKIWLDYDSVMNGKTDSNELEWTITTTVAEEDVDNGTAISDESVSDANGYLVLNRSDLSKFKFGTVGCQQLNITTASYATAPIDSYSGTLTLKVASV